MGHPLPIARHDAQPISGIVCCEPPHILFLVTQTSHGEDEAEFKATEKVLAIALPNFVYFSS